jgi:hypothetical protein
LETFPRTFSLTPCHPVSVASDTALAGLLDTSRCCVLDLNAFIRVPQYPWRMPQGREVHPCVNFLMGNRVSLYFVLDGGRDGNEERTTPLPPDEAVLEEKSGVLASLG